MTNGNFTQEPIQERQPALGLSGSSRVDECRRLVAKRYADEGYIAQTDIDGGFISAEVDPYVSHSEYFWSTDRNNNVESTMRMIKNPIYDRDWEFPIQRDFELHSDIGEYITWFNDHAPENIVEISALAEVQGANEFASLNMFRTVWQHAKRQQYRVCLVSADERLDKKLSTLFGGAIQQAGEPRFVMGSQTVPSILSPFECAKATRDIYRLHQQQSGQESADNYRSIIGYLIDGLESHHLSKEEKFYFHQMGLDID